MPKGIVVKPGTSARERLLEAACAVAERSGVAALTLDAVAAEAGVSKGGLLYHFPSKEALLSGMVDRLCGTCGDLAAAAAQADPEPVGPVRARVSRGLRRRSVALKPLDGTRGRAGLQSGVARCLASRHAGRPGVADEEEGVDPTAAEIVRLAADGMWVRGVLGLPGPDEELKAKVLARLNQLTLDDQRPGQEKIHGHRMRSASSWTRRTRHWSASWGPRAADGSPHVVPVWYRWDGHDVLVWTHEERLWVRNLRRDPRVAFSVQEPKPPYGAVTVRGQAEIRTAGAEAGLRSAASPAAT